MKKYSILKKSLILVAVLISLLITLSLVTNAFQNGYDLFQKALAKERGEGNLEEAISLYQKVVKEASDKSLAAKAQLRIGICYEKLGRKEAQKAFQKVIDNYPSQTDTVKVAKEKLSILMKAQTVIKKGDKEFKISRVWAGTDLDVLGEISPDGHYISYTDWSTGGLAIWEVATGKKRHLTKKDHYGYVLRSPWAPDSKQIAYNWHNEDNYWDLRIIGTDGSEPKVLYRNGKVFPQPADWSPDGKNVLAILTWEKERTSQICLISVADGSISILRNFEVGAPYVMNFSPDGRYIVYDLPQQKGSDERDIFIYSIEEKRETPLIQHLADDITGGWMPDGKNVLFGSDRRGTWDGWVITIEEGKPKGTPIRVKPNIGYVFPMGFTDSGSFYYGLRTGTKDVYIATFDFKKGKLLSPPEKISKRFVGANFSADWSPDGRQLTYLSKHLDPGKAFGTTVGTSTLHILSLNTGEEHELARPQHILLGGGGPRWSLDGHSILVSGWGRDLSQGIYKVNVKSGDMSPIFYRDDIEGRIMDPNWSLDGKAIFFSRAEWRKKTYRIFMYDIENKQKKELHSQTDFTVNWLTLSPDGQFLAFATWDKDIKGQKIKIMPAEGGELRDIVSIPGGGCWSIIWTPDGNDILYHKILFAKDEKAKGHQLWKISTKGGDPKKIWESKDYSFDGLRIHPDGQRLSFTSGEMSSEIWIMENFLPEQKAKKK